MPLLLRHAPQVLLIEDDPDLLGVLHSALTEEGLQVTLATSAAQAQVLLGQNTFACMVTDLLRPPQGDPFSTVETFRRLAPTTPLVLMTAWPLTPEAVARRGYQGLLSKPFDLEAFVRLVQTGLTSQPVVRSLVPPRGGAKEATDAGSDLGPAPTRRGASVCCCPPSTRGSPAAGTPGRG